jgi:DNA (cytosine-5)-methyltransferase 1
MARTAIPTLKASTVRVLDLFAGIGGFTVGLERAGFETVAFCEIDPYAQKVLKKNWPGVPIYDDVRTITAERLASDGIGVDVITGGFPCPDISVAGNQRGIEAERSGLWTECARLLGELRPQYAIFENVTNLLNGERGAWFKRVLWDISQIGYDAEWHCIPASELGAHHHRDRIWIVVYPSGERQHNSLSGSGTQRGEKWTEQLGSSSFKNNVADTSSVGHGQCVEQANRTGGASKGGITRSSVLADTECKPRWNYGGLEASQSQWPYSTTESRPICEKLTDTTGQAFWWSEPDVGRVAHGIPSRSHRLKCLGNAVVPPIPELIGRAINGHR